MKTPACRWPPAGAGRNDAAPPAALAGGVGVARPAGQGAHQRQKRPAFSVRHLDLRTGRRVLMASRHQRLADFHRFLRRLRHGVGACGALWLLLDRHGSHQSPSSLRLAEKLGIQLFWLPRQHPKLNPVDHLWRGLKNTLAANRQFASVDELAAYAEAWVRALTPPRRCEKLVCSRRTAGSENYAKHSGLLLRSKSASVEKLRGECSRSGSRTTKLGERSRLASGVTRNGARPQHAISSALRRKLARIE